jgi:ferredoxin
MVASRHPGASLVSHCVCYRHAIVGGDGLCRIMTVLTPVQAKVSPIVLSKRRGFVDCVHYYKDAMLGRFYAICNCCSCCCGAMQAQRNGTPMLAFSGYVAVVDEELCAGCGTCADVCQFAAISVDEGLARVDGSSYMGCGVCVAHCPQEAISLVRDSAKGEPLEIQKLIASAAQAA